MSSRHTKNRVRDFELTNEDAARLAECLTSFNDSDSWPGGFNEGNPFTAEEVLDFNRKTDDIRVIVAYEGSRIVGHCNVCPHPQDLEAAYVGLLGVNPAFQGKGYGKAMLIEAAETAAKAGFRRIDLHTWAGNLKAVPLYKRVGYNWVPNTRVLMESHIPGIINNPLFQEFFNRHYWYDAYKPIIRQEPDDIVEEGIGIFKYHFEGENGDTLDVTIDREAKGICGFALTLDGQTISAKVVPETHTGFIAVGAYPFEIKVINGGPKELPYKIIATPSENFTVKTDSDMSGVLAPGEEASLVGTYAISSKTKHVDRETNPDEKVKTQVEWSLNLGTVQTKLYSGLVPVAAVSLSMGPTYPCLSPGESGVVALGYQNNTGSSLTGVIELEAPASQNLGVERIEYSLAAHEQSEHALSLIADSETMAAVIPIKVSVYVRNGSNLTLIDKKRVSIPIIGVGGTIAYEAINERIVIENEQLRAAISSRPPMYFREIENKVTREVVTGWFLFPELGYPFPNEGGEWDRKEFDVKVTNEEDHSQIDLEGDSTDRPGLRYRISHRLYPSRDYIETRVSLMNLGTETYANLGVRIGGWTRVEFPELIVPLRGRIHILDSPEWTGGGQLPHKPDAYHEHWIAMTNSAEGLVAGIIYDSEGVAEIRPRRSDGLPLVEYGLPDLKPGESVEKDILRLIMTNGIWHDVRALWARLNGKPLEALESHDIRSDLEVAIVPSGAEPHRLNGSPLLLDAAKANEFDLSVHVIHETPIDVDVKVRMPRGLLANGKRELELETTSVGIDQPLKKKLEIKTERLDAWLRREGEIELEFGNRIKRIPFIAIIYDSDVKVEKKVEAVEGLKLHTLLSNGWQMAVSPDYAGSLVRFGRDGQSVFHDTFPKSEPFIWWDRYFSGLNPWIQGWSVWDWESAFWKESWMISDREIGQWKGFEMTTEMKHSPGLKGMVFSARFMTVPGLPLMQVELTASNLSGQWKRFNYGLRGTARPASRVQNKMHSVTNGQRITYEPTENRARLFPDSRAGWVAYGDKASGEVLGVISTLKTKPSLSGLNIGRDAQMMITQETVSLRPNEVATSTTYFVIVEDEADIPLIKNLPKDIH
ncbi:MAG: GNAT family N-acetyltransferase [Promethearchaeota archaeon]